MKELAQAIDAVDSVTNIEKVAGNAADYVVYFEAEYGVQSFRTEWLKNHRESFTLGDYQENGANSWMHVTTKKEA